LESESKLSNLGAWQLRPVRPADKNAIITLIDTIFREYGDRIFLEGADADLLDIAAHYEPGLFMVLAAADDVRGTVALQYKSDDRAVASLRRMYLHEDLRGTGAGARMLEWALSKAAALGARRVELWTDARFERAHQFYQKFGFTDSGDVRLMHDGAMPYEEFRYYMDL
jgi:putative acetyltransferase